ncbi:hypothetical protein BFGS084_03324 [Bacteroides fragilis]|nr:hypothetical protein BFGS084_03324 [Bacteroides fragilis]
MVQKSSEWGYYYKKEQEVFVNQNKTPIFAPAITS